MHFVKTNFLLFFLNRFIVERSLTGHPSVKIGNCAVDLKFLKNKDSVILNYLKSLEAI